MQTPLTRILILGLTLGLGATGSSAADLTQPLTAEEVACNERQLERLLARIQSGDEVYGYPQVPKGLFVSYSNSAGFYDGLALAMQWWRLDIGQIPPADEIEHYLAFQINPSIRTLLVNPARPQLGQVSLGREQSNSNLVSPGTYPGRYFELKVKIDPSLPGNPQPDLLEINNYVEPGEGEPYNGFLANSTKPGRGLSEDGLLTACHDKLTPFDRHVFSILQRMIRFFHDGFGLLDWKGAIFRGTDPHTYRFNLFPFTGARTPPRGRVAGEIRLSWTPEGKLTTGTWQILPSCNQSQELGCTTLSTGSAVALLTPLFGGVEQHDNSDFDRTAISMTENGPSPAVTVDFEKMLSKTTWNTPPF